MTLSSEEARALNITRTLLVNLLEWPRTPSKVRRSARCCLRHYPAPYRVEELFNADAKEQMLKSGGHDVGDFYRESDEESEVTNAEVAEKKRAT